MNSIFHFRFEIEHRKSSEDVLLLFAATQDLDPEALATIIESEVEKNLVPDQVVLIVRDPSFEETKKALVNDSQNIATIGRLGGRSTFTLVGYNIMGAETRRVHISGPESRRTIQFQDFRRRAITHIFVARHGFVESTATYHFENPSGRHTERFIRLSNILVRGAEIAFVGFCTMPFIAEDVSVVYLDTPSLYAIVSSINEQRSSFSGASRILADNFSSYGGLGAYRFTRIADAAVLVSASSSGSLAGRLVVEHGFSSKQITHILFLGTDSSDSNIVCDLRKDAKHNDEGFAELPSVQSADNCIMCRAGSHAIKLQGDQFEFAGPQQESLLIAKSYAPEGLSGLMGRFAGGKLFGVGLGRSVGRQPRQFNIEPAALLSHEKFQERFEYVARRSLPASLRHVLAMDEASIDFAAKIAESVSADTLVVKREDLETIPVYTETAIAIAAIVIESGRSLLDISRDLRTISPRAPLLYLVGFSKTTGEPRREALERTLIQTVNFFPYQLIELERMTLPLASASNPWAEELRLFINPDVQKIVPPDCRQAVDKRVERLRKTSVPLEADLFLPNDDTRKLSLQPGFVFWPDGVPRREHSQADVYFTVASVLQQLRANAHRTHKAAIKSNWFQQTILAPENFGRFNDDIIQASLLRAAHPYEMNFADSTADSRELGRLIRRIVSAARTERGGAAAEFLLALATGRLRLRRADLEEALSVEPGAVPMVEFLRAVCKSLLF